MNDLIGLLILIAIVFGPIVVIWTAWLHVRRNRSFLAVAPFVATSAAIALSVGWVVVLSLFFNSASLGTDVGRSIGSVARPAEPFERILEEQLQPLSTAFFAPSPVKRDETFEATLRVSPPSVSPEEVAQQLQAEAGRLGESAQDYVKYEPIYVASLTSDRPARIVLQGESPSRAIVPDETVTWRWYVTASDGPLNLTATLNTPMTVNGIATGAEVHDPFTKTVTVTVTPAQRFGDLLAFAKDYWALLGGLVAAVGWLFAKWRRRQRAPRSYERAP